MITLQPTDDMETVEAIAFHGDIWERFSDGVKKQDYEPPNTNREQWLIIKYNDEIAGIIRVYCKSTCAIEFHPYMLKKYRRYVREMALRFFEWFLTLPEQIVKINVLTPECYKSVLNAEKKTGFIQEGIIRDSYRLDGQVYNQIASGITREEVKLWVA